MMITFGLLNAMFFADWGVDFASSLSGGARGNVEKAGFDGPSLFQKETERINVLTGADRISTLDKITRRVDDAIASGDIASMNVLLTAFSNEKHLSKETRDQQQQRLRVAIGHHCCQQKEATEREGEVQREPLTRGRSML